MQNKLKRHIFPKKSIVKRLTLYTCIVILLPAILLCIIFYYFYSTNLDQGVREQFESALTQSAEHVDRLLQQTEEQTWQCLNSMENGVFSQPPDYLMMARDIRHMEETIYASSIIDDMWIYNPEKEIVLSASYGYMKERYCPQKDALKESLKMSTRSGWIKLSSDFIAYFQKLPLYLEGNEKGVSLIEVSCNHLSEGLSFPKTIYPNTRVILFDNKGEMQYTDLEEISELQKLDNYKNSMLNINSNFGSFESENSQKIIHFIRTTRGWFILTMTPIKDLNSSKNAFRVYAIFMFISVVILIIVVSLVYTSYVYSPIHKLWTDSRLLKGENDEQQFSINEYAYIRELLHQYDKECHMLQKKLCAMKPVLRSELLRFLLEGKQCDDLETNLREVDISLDCAISTCLITFHHSKKLPSIEEVRDSICTLSGLYKYCDVIEKELGWFCFVFYWNNEMTNLEIEDATIKSAVNLSEYFQSCFEIQLTAGIGSAEKSVTYLFDSYQRALLVSRSRFIKDGEIISYRQVCIRPEREYYYPIQLEMQIIQAVRSGNLEECKKSFQEVFRKNTMERSLDPNTANCLFFDLIGTLIKIKNDPMIKSKELFDEQALENIFQCQTFQEIYEDISSLLEKVCQGIHLGKKQSYEEIIHKVESYIHSHYVENDLSQTQIAEIFGLSQPMLSALFKQYTGTNMVDYINQLRVEHAKRLLCGKDVKITDIFSESGFGSVKSMIRIFKRYEGMTPGQFREKHL